MNAVHVPGSSISRVMPDDVWKTKGSGGTASFHRTLSCQDSWIAVLQEVV